MRDLAPFTYPKMKDLTPRRRAARCASARSSRGTSSSRSSSSSASSAGRRTSSRASPTATATRRSSAPCRACATTSSTSSAATAAPRTWPRSTSATAAWTARRAAKLIDEHDGKRPASLDVFLEYVGIDEEQFMEVVAKHVVVAVAAARPHPDRVGRGAVGPPDVGAPSGRDVRAARGRAERAAAGRERAADGGRARDVQPGDRRGDGRRGAQWRERRAQRRPNGREAHRNGTSVPPVAAPAPPDESD